MCIRTLKALAVELRIQYPNLFGLESPLGRNNSWNFVSLPWFPIYRIISPLGYKNLYSRTLIWAFACSKANKLTRINTIFFNLLGTRLQLFILLNELYIQLLLSKSNHSSLKKGSNLLQVASFDFCKRPNSWFGKEQLSSRINPIPRKFLHSNW